MKKITIAIDGYSSCGKSTMAKDLAREVGYIYIDSGAKSLAMVLFPHDEYPSMAIVIFFIIILMYNDVSTYKDNENNCPYTIIRGK